MRRNLTLRLNRLNSVKMSISENDIHWYVFSVSYKKELNIRNELLRLGLDAYVPMRYCLQTVHGKKLRKQVPAIYGLVFVKGNRKQLLDYRETSSLKPYMFLKSHRMMDGTLQYIYIRDDDMDNFRKLNEVRGAELTYFKPEELRLAKGEKVKIMDGPFEGITGIIQKLPNKHGQYLVVSLPDVAIAAVSIKPNFVKPLSDKVAKSTDVEKDSKRMAQLALDIITDKGIANKLEVISEMRQLGMSLQGCKVFLPNDKANFYFAFYAAAIADRRPADEYKNKLKEVLPKLKNNNLLLPIAHLLFFYETQDEQERHYAESIINKWDNAKYTNAQRQVIKLQRSLAHQQADAANNKQTEH